MIITCCPSKVHNGVWRHLKELEQFGTVHYEVDDRFDRFDLDNVKMIIFGGSWNNQYAEINKVAKSKNVKTALLFCSPFGQAALSNEIPHLIKAYDLLLNGFVDYLFTGTQEMADILNHPRVKFLPQTLDYKTFMEKHEGEVEKRDKAVGLFCSKAWHKNIVNQMIGLRKTDYHLFTNAFDKDTTTIALTHDVRYTSFEWLNDKEYYNLLKMIPVHLQCSYSEAFDYVVAETLLLGNPVIVGPTIDWVKLPELKVSNIDNPFEIKTAIDNLFASPVEGKDLIKMVKLELDRRAKIAKQVLDQI